MSKLAGKVAVITGGSTGIGLATARLFAAEGATIVIAGVRQDELDAAVQEIGGDIEGVQGDIGNLNDIEKLRAHVQRRHGQVDIVFANAGMVGAVTPFGEVSPENFDQVFGVNVRGTFFTVQSLLPLIRDGGAIILTSSVTATKGYPSFSVYAASKAAIRSFARSWTTDLKHRKIRVNALSPGTIATGIARAFFKTAAEHDEFLDYAASLTPLGRTGSAEEMASAALFLASSDSSFVAGSELTVDGGLAQV